MYISEGRKEEIRLIIQDEIKPIADKLYAVIELKEGLSSDERKWAVANLEWAIIRVD